MWEVSWRRRQTATYWPQISLYYSSTSSSFCWGAQPGSWGPKPSVWRWLSLRHLVPNCDWNSNCDCNSNWTLPASNINSLKPSVAPGYIIVWCTPASCRCTYLHRIQPRLQVKVISSTGCTCFFRLFTQVHLLIDGSVEGQYVTYIYIYMVGHRRGRGPEDPLFNSDCIEVLESTLLLSLDCSSLPLIRTL